MPTESNEKWQHLSRLLDQVLDLDAQQRVQWLESLANSDPEMAEIVSTTLAAKEREGFTGFLAGSAIDLKGIGESTLVGRQVGPYVIDAEIGRGQPTNSDARDVEMLRTRLAFASREFQQTLKHAQAALEIAKAGAIDPQSSAWIGEALLWRARAEAALGDRLKAKATAQEALPHLEKNLDAASATLAAARELAAA